jgi:hypothetical protein
MEPGNKFLTYNCGIVAVELTVHNQTTCANDENGVFLNVRDVRFGFSPNIIEFAIPNA